MVVNIEVYVRRSRLYKYLLLVLGITVMFVSGGRKLNIVNRFRYYSYSNTVNIETSWNIFLEKSSDNTYDE